MLFSVLGCTRRVSCIKILSRLYDIIVFCAVDFGEEVKRGQGCTDIPIKIAH